MNIQRRFYYLLKRLASVAGVRLVLSKNIGKIVSKEDAYEPIVPLSTYAPWLCDAQFNEVYGQIFEYTMVDKYRCYELWTLVKQLSQKSGAILEVGTWKGGSGALMAKQAALCGIDTPLYLCDTFEGVAKATSKDSTYKGGEHADASKAEVEELLSSLGLSNAEVLEGVFPENTQQLVKADFFGLCHIDVDVYQSAKDVWEWVWPKMVTGGVVVFDDFGFEGCDGVTSLVNELRISTDALFLHNLNGHAVVVKVG